MIQTLGIREFRDNFTRIAREGGEPVIVKNHNRVVGWYTPARIGRTERDAAWERLQASKAAWIADGFDPEAALASLGMDLDGNPLDEC